MLCSWRRGELLSSCIYASLLCRKRVKSNDMGGKTSDNIALENLILSHLIKVDYTLSKAHIK